MRILSLLPAATEMVYLLGLEKSLVGVSHECDFPAEAKKKPKITISSVGSSMSSRQIDKQVRKLAHRGPGVFHIKEEVLKKLKPDLILTQEICEVCAVGFSEVKKAARILEGEVKIVSLEPESVNDILENIRLVGKLGDKEKEAEKIVKNLKNRIENLKQVIGKFTKPKICVVEWLDPLMIAGHWVPEMVGKAGGENLISKREEKSKAINIHQIKQIKPDVLVISPCGFDIYRTIKEIDLVEKLARSVGVKKIVLMDGNSYMTRPGPRIVDGIEILAEIFYPDIFRRKHSQKAWKPVVIS